MRINRQLEVVDLIEHPLHVGALVGERGVGELHEALLHGRAQDHLATNADRRRLGASGELRHIDGEVAHGGGHAGEPPALRQLLCGEGALVKGGDGHARVEHLHLALLARAVSAAGGVDCDAVPERSVEDTHAIGHAHGLARGLEGQADTRRPGMARRVGGAAPVGLGGRVIECGHA